MSYGSRVTLTVAAGLLAAYIIYIWSVSRRPEPPVDSTEEEDDDEVNTDGPQTTENVAETNEEVPKITISVGVYYASQTGTAEKLAKTLAAFLASWDGVFRPDAVNLEDWKEEFFLQEGAFAIFLVSTHDDGLFPDNAIPFVKWLRKCNKEGQNLDTLSFCIFGLGSSEYPLFNQAAKNLQKLLNKRGAYEFMPIVLGDDTVDLKSDFGRWKTNLCQTLLKVLKLEVHPPESPLKKLCVTPSDTWRSRASLELRYLDSDDTKQEFEPKIANVICKQQWQCSDHVVLENVCMTPEGDGQTHCIVLKSHEEFKCAETANILYANPPEVVDYFVNRLNIGDTDMEKIITFVPRYGKRDEGGTFDAPFPVPCTIKDALLYYLDLTGLPSVEVLSDLGTFLRTPQECELYNKVLTSDAILKRMKEELHFTLPEFVEIFMSGVPFNLGGFLQLVPPKIPKPYTISSHPKTQKMEFTVKLVQFSTHSFKSFKKTIERGLDYQVENIDEEFFHKRRFYKGVCTHFLCSLKPGDVVKLYRRPSAFSSVEALEAKPIVMIANGAGIAPFRGLWQNDDEDVSRILFYGCRDSDHVLYKEELEELKRRKTFSIHMAFSREKDHTYVQQMVRTQINTVRDVIQNDGVVCVCGSKQMGAQVKAILQRFLNTDIASIKDKGQYVEELW